MWDTTTYLLSQDFVITALVACAFLGVLSGVLAPLIVMRQMSFAVHATSELALMGAAAALVLGFNLSLGAVLGSIAAAIALALLGFKGGNDSAVGVVMSFGMGISVLCIYLYPGNSSIAMSLLTGQVVGVAQTSVWALAITTVIVVAAVVALWRPLLFSSIDPVMAAATGVRVRTMATVFAILVGLAAANSVQIVGVLLVMALLITPGASAVAVTANPKLAVLLSVVFAEVSAVGGFILSLAPGLPVSVLVAFVSFGIYVVCRGIGALQARRIQSRN
ncbi:metal ABC transporter permease [Corynebacterium hadale]|uniref:metal ABC transporter permease n=1 Tax=Corynebacterium hadale TaxID=2026255 RepID=UPI001EF19991|nr:metal ABC transporter permease [Corynebacterium hadale]MCG7254734.1 metal ABC transporter permease [Corynebacterium hadale]MCG7257127.1 metal ABC transporter permease [Corynebacterium hadale]MCG7265614.1 metal ABC transporter permease [Corynebacterium hadale]